MGITAKAIANATNCAPTSSSSADRLVNDDGRLWIFERRDQQRQRDRVGGIEERDRSVELGPVAREAHGAIQSACPAEWSGGLAQLDQVAVGVAQVDRAHAPDGARAADRADLDRHPGLAQLTLDVGDRAID